MFDIDNKGNNVVPTGSLANKPVIAIAIDQ